MHRHGVPCPDGVMGCDCLQHHAVGHDRLVNQFFVGHIHEHHDRRVDDGDKLLDNHIFAALRHTGVERDVVFNVAVSIVDFCFHPLAKPPQAGNILIRRVVGGHLCNARFQQQTHIDKVQRQRGFVLNRA